MHSALRRISIPSASRISRIASRNVRVFPAGQARRLLDHSDRGAQAPENLSELEPDIASSDDDKAPGQGVELEQRRVGQRPRLIEAREIGRVGPATDVDEEAVPSSTSSPTLTVVGDRKRA